MKKNAKGYYCSTITLGRDKEGKYIRKYIYAKTQNELNNKIADLRVQYNNGLDIANDNITFEQMKTIWKNLRLKNKSNAYIKNCECLLKHVQHLNPLQLKQIRPLMIQEVINGLVAEGKHNTAHKLLQVLKTIFELAVDNDYLVKSPAKTIPFPHYVKDEKSPLTKAEQDIILNSNHPHADFFQVLLLTGMRKGEISALTWNDIDFEKQVIHVNKACDFTTNNPTIKSTKNGKARDIPMIDKVNKILSNSSKNSIYVFHKVNGEMLSDTAIKRMLESFLNETKLDFTLHQLRHTFCTILYYAGISSKKAQLIMGHSSLSVTMNIYTHLAEDMEDNTTDVLNKFI